MRSGRGEEEEDGVQMVTEPELWQKGHQTPKAKKSHQGAAGDWVHIRLRNDGAEVDKHGAAGN